MVHVEIWMGDGPKTLGARNQRGVIEVHDSYQFVSKGYGDMKYYFRSLETWLDGVCVRYVKQSPLSEGPFSSSGCLAVVLELCLF